MHRAASWRAGSMARCCEPPVSATPGPPASGSPPPNRTPTASSTPPPGRRPPRSTPTSPSRPRSEEHTSELQSRGHLVCRLLLEKKKKQQHEVLTCSRSDKVRRVCKYKTKLQHQ